MNNAYLQSMFPLIFLSLRAHKIYFVQHFTWTRLNLEWHVWNMCIHIFGRNIYVHFKFSCVRSSNNVFVRAHRLYGTLLTIQFQVRTDTGGEYMLIVWLIESAGFVLPLLLPSTVLAAVKFLLLWAISLAPSFQASWSWACSDEEYLITVSRSKPMRWIDGCLVFERKGHGATVAWLHEIVVLFVCCRGYETRLRRGWFAPTSKINKSSSKTENS